MPRYTDRYDALESGKPLIERKSRRSSAPVKKTNFFAILLIAVLCAILLAVCVAIVMAAPQQEVDALARVQKELRARTRMSHAPVDLSRFVAKSASTARRGFVPQAVEKVPVRAAAAALAADSRKAAAKPTTFGDNFWAVESAYVQAAGKQREQLAWVPLQKVADARLFSASGPSAKDFVQSSHVGNCWLLAAVGSLVNALPEYLTRFSSGAEPSKAGLYTVNLFDPLSKQWTPVTVDDTLPVDFAHTPVMAELGQKLFGANPTATDAFWMMIVEKAIAQLKSRSGDYYSMAEGGSAELAWEMLTGQQAAEAWELEGNYASKSVADMAQFGVLA